MTKATSEYLNRPLRSLRDMPAHHTYAGYSNAVLDAEKDRLEACIGALERALEAVRVQARGARQAAPFEDLNGGLQDEISELRGWVSRVEDAESGS